MEEILKYSAPKNTELEESNNTPTQPVITTDTGYHHEDVLKKYVDIVFYVGLGIIALMFITQVYNARGSFEIVLGALVINVLYGLLLYLFRSFVYVFRNISINLHEMNMKMREKEYL